MLRGFRFWRRRRAPKAAPPKRGLVERVREAVTPDDPVLREIIETAKRERAWFPPGRSRAQWIEPPGRYR